MQAEARHQRRERPVRHPKAWEERARHELPINDPAGPEVLEAGVGRHLEHLELGELDRQATVVPLEHDVGEGLIRAAERPGGRELTDHVIVIGRARARERGARAGGLPVGTDEVLVGLRHG